MAFHYKCVSCMTRSNRLNVIGACEDCTYKCRECNTLISKIEKNKYNDKLCHNCYEHTCSECNMKISKEDRLKTNIRLCKICNACSCCGSENKQIVFSDEMNDYSWCNSKTKIQNLCVDCYKGRCTQCFKVEKLLYKMVEEQNNRNIAYQICGQCMPSVYIEDKIIGDNKITDLYEYYNKKDISGHLCKLYFMIDTALPVIMDKLDSLARRLDLMDNHQDSAFEQLNKIDIKHCRDRLADIEDNQKMNHMRLIKIDDQQNYNGERIGLLAKCITNINNKLKESDDHIIHLYALATEQADEKIDEKIDEQERPEFEHKEKYEVKFCGYCGCRRHNIDHMYCCSCGKQHIK